MDFHDWTNANIFKVLLILGTEYWFINFSASQRMWQCTGLFSEGS